MKARRRSRFSEGEIHRAPPRQEPLRDALMYTSCDYLYIGVTLWAGGQSNDSWQNPITQALPFGLSTIKRAQRVLHGGTETETIEHALDLVVSEHERNRRVAQANERFVTSGIDIRDVYGTLAAVDAGVALRYIDLHGGVTHARRCAFGSQADSQRRTCRQ